MVGKIAEVFNTSFKEFKEDKDVVMVFPFRKRDIVDGEARDKVKGTTIGVTKMEGFSH